MAAKQQAAEWRRLLIDSTELTYFLTRKQVKNINLRIRSDGTVAVSAHPRVTIDRIEQFICREADFIGAARVRLQARRAQAPRPLLLLDGEHVPIGGVFYTVSLQKSQRREVRIEEGQLVLCLRDPESYPARKRAFDEFLDREARALLEEMTRRALPLFYPKPPTMPALFFRTMKSKWGVCRPTQGRITLNRNLIYLPTALAEYVVFHELMHFAHPDHSPAFWAALGRRMPDCKERRRALAEFPVPSFSDGQDTVDEKPLRGESYPLSYF